MKLYITGGGTGGHVTPGLAIARHFKTHHPDAEIRFAGTETGIESKLIPPARPPPATTGLRGLRPQLTPAPSWPPHRSAARRSCCATPAPTA